MLMKSLQQKEKDWWWCQPEVGVNERYSTPPLIKDANLNVSTEAGLQSMAEGHELHLYTSCRRES